MSCREEEQGSLVLPSVSVIAVRRALVDAENLVSKSAFDLAVHVRDYLKSPAGKPDLIKIRTSLRKDGYRGGERVLSDVVARQAQAKQGSSREDTGDVLWRATRSLLKPPAQGENPRLTSPKKQDFPLLPAQTWSFSSGSCSVSIDAASRTLRWDVDRSNHAVDHAWASPLGRALKIALEAIIWTRGTGGSFNYSNEYGQEAAMEHGGNPISISKSFGPLGAASSSSRFSFPTQRRKTASPRR